MKTIKRIKIKNAVALNEEQLKKIYGGSGSSYNSVSGCGLLCEKDDIYKTLNECPKGCISKIKPLSMICYGSNSIATYTCSGGFVHSSIIANP